MNIQNNMTNTRKTRGKRPIPPLSIVTPNAAPVQQQLLLPNGLPPAIVLNHPPPSPVDIIANGQVQIVPKNPNLMHQDDLIIANPIPPQVANDNFYKLAWL